MGGSRRPLAVVAVAEARPSLLKDPHQNASTSKKLGIKFLNILSRGIFRERG